MAPLKLMWSNIAARKIRAGLTAAAIGLSVSLVVAVTSGYASVESAALAYLHRYLGSADAQITRPESLQDGLIPQEIAVELMRDPAAHRITGRLEVPSNLYGKDGNLTERVTFNVIGILRPQDTRIDSLAMEAGNWFDSGEGNFAVVDQVTAEALKVKVGDSFAMPSEHGKLTFQVTGIVHKPEILATASKTVYVPLRTLQEFENVLNNDPQVSRIAIDFETGADPDAFQARWEKRLADLTGEESRAAGHPVPPLKLRMVRADRAAMDLNLRAVHALSYLGDAISMLAATFIIFSSLAMGVTERQRTLAMLRALGATRRQVAALVISEGMSLTAVGAAVGIPLGVVWTQCLRLLFPEYFISGVSVSGTGILMAGCGALVAALTASLLPAWSASRLTPIEAMAPLADPGPTGPPLKWAVLGLLLIAIDPLLFYAPLEKVVARFSGTADPFALTTFIQFWAHYTIGVEGLFIGFFLISPLLVWIAERFAAPLLARLSSIPAPLLRQQLSGGIWRASGAAAALMVGLAALIVLTTTGTSMLEGWKLPDKFPDIFMISLRLGGLNPNQMQAFGNTPGIRHYPDGSPEVMPIAVTISGLGNNPLALVGAVLAPTVNGTMFFGVPPKMAMDMMELDFRDNEGHPVSREQQSVYRQRAEQELELGRHLIVTEDYRRLHHAHYGDKITLFSNNAKYEYTICGIVWTPGLDVIVAMFDLGKQFDQRTAGMVFGTLDDARRDFGADHVNLFAANLEYGVDKLKVMDDLKKHLGDLNIKAGDVRQIKAAIDGEFRRLMALLTTVAFSAMAVASMGVTNTIMASVRSRRWQLGILRSIGLRANDLMKLVLAEAILVGAVGLTLGLGCGTILAFDARQLGAGMLGYLPPMVIPWGYVSLGGLGVMFVSIAAAWWPARSVSRTQPLALLQAGRAAT